MSTASKPQGITKKATIGNSTPRKRKAQPSQIGLDVPLSPPASSPPAAAFLSSPPGSGNHAQRVKTEPIDLTIKEEVMETPTKRARHESARPTPGQYIDDDEEDGTGQYADNASDDEYRFDEYPDEGAHAEVYGGSDYI
jgi:hypothetical protein